MRCNFSVAREKYQRSTKEAAALVSCKKSTMGKTFNVFTLSAVIVLVSLGISLASEPPVNQTDGDRIEGLRSGGLLHRE